MVKILRDKGKRTLAGEARGDIDRAGMRRTLTSTPGQTIAAGRELSARLAAGAVVALCGDLGAGKTHFVRGMAEGWGAAESAASPTFALLHEYDSPRGPIRHLDLYRALSAAEVWSAVHDEMHDDSGLLVIEWADRFPELVPPGATWVHLRYAGDGQRELEIDP